MNHKVPVSSLDFVSAEQLAAMEYKPLDQLLYNFILDADSYKLSHPELVKATGVKQVVAYGEPRIKGKTIVNSGLQMYVNRYLSRQLTTAMIDEAEAFAALHGEPFNRSDWDYIVEKYDGFIPAQIWAVPEGLPVPSSNISYRVVCKDNRLPWLVGYIETALQRACWYPTTIASEDFETKKMIREFFLATGADLGSLPFMLHDFGGRGATCYEQSEVGSAAHMPNFMGSDTMSGIRAANHFYAAKMAAFSVVATEHTIQILWGKDRQREYLLSVLNKYAKKGAIVSIVIDGYDTFACAAALCSDPEIRKIIDETGVKVVFRPDSGDPREIIPKLLKMQEDAFGFDLNAKGFKKIRQVGLLQGDGVDREVIREILTIMQNLGYAADNIVFGSGGALLQKVNRDTKKFVQKACAGLFEIDGEDVWVGISKDPITDPGKASKSGYLSLFRSVLTGEYNTIDKSHHVDSEWVEVMKLIYDTGKFYNFIKLDEVRANTGLFD